MQRWLKTRLLCTEPLEGRWLLSGASDAADEDADETADDTEVRVETSDLPAPVVSAIRAQYADADIVEAVLTTEDDVSAYEVSARYGEGSVELTLTSAGTILETEVLPPPIVDPVDVVDDLVDPIPSTTPAPGATVTNSVPGVEVVEIEPATEDEADGDVDVARSKLPRVVRDAFDARFPGAAWIEPEFGYDDGAGEFDITAEFQGHVIDVTLTPAGEIIETEQAVTSDELPKEVLDWVRARFGADAEIGEATVVFEDGSLGFEVVVESSDGSETEATVRVAGAQPPRGFPLIEQLPDEGSNEGAPPGSAPLVPPADASSVARSGDGVADNSAATADDAAMADAATAARSLEPPAVAAPPAEADSQRAGAAPTTGTADAQSLVAGARMSRSADLHEALQSLVAGTPPAAWLPALAEVLDDVLPADLAAVERGLQAVLREIDALIGDVSGRAVAARDGLTPLVAAAALIAATQMFLLNSRRARTGGPVLIFSAAASSWSWVLGTTTTTATKPKKSEPSP